MKGGYHMKSFVKIFISLLAVFGALVGVLAVIDKIQNKNRIKGDYLECDTEEETI